MSATRDKSQRHTFVYRNMYHVYKGTEKVNNIVTLHEKKPTKPTDPLSSLAENLTTLNQLHSRLNEMLAELESLVREEE